MDSLSQELDILGQEKFNGSTRLGEVQDWLEKCRQLRNLMVKEINLSFEVMIHQVMSSVPSIPRKRILEDRCYQCGEKGHYIKECNTRIYKKQRITEDRYQLRDHLYEDLSLVSEQPRSWIDLKPPTVLDKGKRILEE